MNPTGTFRAVDRCRPASAGRAAPRASADPPAGSTAPSGLLDGREVNNRWTWVVILMA